MRTLHIILPMAGYGSRFAKVGITTPKPLIEVDGKPMFLKAINSFKSIDVPKRYTVILRDEHIKEHDIKNRVHAALPEANIVTTNQPATGALRDAARSEPFLEPDEGVIVMDCDIEVGGENYFSMIRASLSGANDIAGGLLLFQNDNPRYSYAQLDKEGYVIRTAEKKVISPYAIGGGYFIATAKTFLEEGKKVMLRPLSDEQPEYFMSYLFNQIIEDGGKIKGAIGTFTSFGTPEELDAYNTSKQ